LSFGGDGCGCHCIYFLYSLHYSKENGKCQNAILKTFATGNTQTAYVGTYFPDRSQTTVSSRYNYRFKQSVDTASGPDCSSGLARAAGTIFQEETECLENHGLWLRHYSYLHRWR
jgi:hypothetical protein